MSAIQFQKYADLICSIRNYRKPIFVDKGAFKETFSVVNSENIKFALKIFDPTKYNENRTIREIDAMRNCTHESIVSLVDFSSVTFDKREINYIIEEFYDGGSLQDHQQSLNSDFLKNVAIDIVDAIKYLRTLNIVHRDIKPANIMFKADSSKAILVDFGLVRNIGEESLTLSWMPMGPGTPFYSSPEQLNNEKSMIDWRSDQFSLGIMIASLILKKHPFQTSEDDVSEAISCVINRKTLPEKTKRILENEGFDFVIQMLEPWPIRRYNCPDKLMHEIINKGE